MFLYEFTSSKIFEELKEIYETTIKEHLRNMKAFFYRLLF